MPRGGVVEVMTVLFPLHAKIKMWSRLGGARARREGARHRSRRHDTPDRRRRLLQSCEFALRSPGPLSFRGDRPYLRLKSQLKEPRLSNPTAPQMDVTS